MIVNIPICEILKLSIFFYNFWEFEILDFYILWNETIHRHIRTLLLEKNEITLVWYIELRLIFNGTLFHLHCLYVHEKMNSINLYK